MEKITINNIEYNVSCNAFTRVKYSSCFGRKIFKDISILNEFNEKLTAVDNEEELSDKEKETKKQKVSLENMDNMLDVLLQLAYVEIVTANPNFVSYDKWLQGLDNIDLSGEWITTVMNLAMNCFRG